MKSINIKQKIDIPEILSDNEELVGNPVYYTLALTIRDIFIRYHNDYRKRHGYPCSQGFIMIEHSLFSDIETKWMEMIMIEVRKEYPVDLYWRFMENVKKEGVDKTLGIFW